MTDDEGQEEEVIEEGQPRAAMAAYRALIGLGERGDGGEQPEPPGPTDWRAVTAEEAPEAWAELREWVEGLVRRYGHLDHHVVPACWYRHNGHVEALVALRDFERLAFYSSSPASSPYNYQVALAQVESRLREWTARAGCLGEHREQPAGQRPVPEDEWDAFVAADAAAREQLGRSSTPK
jgi:hypothetical protein